MSNSIESIFVNYKILFFLYQGLGECCCVRDFPILFIYTSKQEADLAAAPMFKTSERQQVVDFSVPFLDVHATLLQRKPPPGVLLKIASVEDLLGQFEFKYGTLDRGIIVRAFKETNSTVLRTIWRNMVTFKPSVFTSSNRGGIARARRTKYIFVIPHTIGDYMSMQEPCDLVTTDRFLLDIGYCLAVNKGSELLTQFNLAIHALRDSGKIRDLYRTWWLDGSNCDPIQSNKIYGSAYVARSLSVRMYLTPCTFIPCVWICCISWIHYLNLILYFFAR